MNRRLFGTDGIRARFGEEPLTPATVRRIGLAVGELLLQSAPNSDLRRVFVGGDTRASTPELASWLLQGLAAAGTGMETVSLGVVPTPAIAWWTARERGACGVAISASHNPAEDNGIKLIDGAGFKWSAAAEAAVERRLASVDDPGPRVVTPRVELEASSRYLRWLVGEGGGRRSLTGLKVAVDAANGAASTLVGPLFRALDAEVELLAAAPDGTNINLGCGSTAPQALQERIANGDFHLGFAFDGDADRCLLIDETGELRDGDAMLYLWARDLQRRGDLSPPRIVATAMSNLGLERALAALGIDVERCGVGDREVVAALKRSGLRLGGEQSGHLLDLHRTTTGDGLLTAVVLAAIVARAARPVAQLLADFRRFPQVLVNVPVASKPALESLDSVARVVRQVEESLGREGRLVLRYSGTEPLARVMIEGPDESSIRDLADQLVHAIRDEIGVTR